MKFNNSISLLLRIVASIILLQTLYFKFSAHPESVILFSKLGVEPWGRIATGVLELITAILLVITPSAFIGAILGVGLMLGAILSHTLVIGMKTNGDGGELFMLAIVVFLCCIITLVLEKYRVKLMYRKYFQKPD